MRRIIMVSLAAFLVVGGITAAVLLSADPTAPVQTGADMRLAAQPVTTVSLVDALTVVAPDSGVLSPPATAVGTGNPAMPTCPNGRPVIDPNPGPTVPAGSPAPPADQQAALLAMPGVCESGPQGQLSGTPGDNGVGDPLSASAGN